MRAIESDAPRLNFDRSLKLILLTPSAHEANPSVKLPIIDFRKDQILSRDQVSSTNIAAGS